MKHLIITSHPNPNSFNEAIKRQLVASLQASGHEVKIRDLNLLGFNPVLSENDLKNTMTGSKTDDIKREQELITWADSISLIYPVWWAGFPAILKGYIDRVFQFGFAYAITDKGVDKLLTGKKALLFTTHGMPKAVYEGEMYKALTLSSDIGIFGFCGIQVLHHEFFASVPSSTSEVRQQYLEKVNEIARKFGSK